MNVECVRMNECDECVDVNEGDVTDCSTVCSNVCADRDATVCSNVCSTISADCDATVCSTVCSTTHSSAHPSINFNAPLFEYYPYYFRDSIIRVSPSGFICIITYWTKRETIFSLISEHNKNKVLTVGNLYTPQGIKYIIQNSLLCPQIQYFICIGNDINNVKSHFNKIRFNIQLDCHPSESFDPETTFWTKFNTNIIHATESTLNTIIESLPSTCFSGPTSCVSVDSLPSTCSYVSLSTHSSVPTSCVSVDSLPSTCSSVPTLNTIIESLPSTHSSVTALNASIEPLPSAHSSVPLSTWIPKPYLTLNPTNKTSTVQSEKIGFIVRDSNLLRLWKRILTKINLFGHLKKSENDKMQKELLGVTSILTQQAVIDEQMPNHELFNDYIPQVIDQHIAQHINTAYTYGSRLHSDNQITNIIADLRNCKHSRRAIAVTWKSNEDSGAKYPPCLILVDFKIQGTQLFMTCYFRSHDIYNAYCMNIIALQQLQQKIMKNISNDLTLGHIMIISNSAHVYEHDFDKILSMKELDCNMDPRGYFLIDINNAPIIHVVLKSSTDEIIKEFKSQSVHTLMDSIQPFVSEISHALYLGKELYKAKSCIIHNETYIQA